jgi:integrase
MPLFEDMLINTITSQMLRTAVNGREWSSAKTRNDALIPLRGVFELACDDEVIDKNPCDRLKNQKTQEDEPDPFNEMEKEIILNWLKEIYCRLPNRVLVFCGGILDRLPSIRNYRTHLAGCRFFK